MARTKRHSFDIQKFNSWIFRIYLDDFTGDINDIDSYSMSEYGFIYANINPHSSTGRKIIAKEIRDGKNSLGPGRKWIRFYHKRDRQRAYQELYKFMCNQDYEVMINANHRHSATYDWW